MLVGNIKNKNDRYINVTKSEFNTKIKNISNIKLYDQLSKLNMQTAQFESEIKFLKEEINLLNQNISAIKNKKFRLLSGFASLSLFVGLGFGITVLNNSYMSDYLYKNNQQNIAKSLVDTTEGLQVKFKKMKQWEHLLTILQVILQF